MPDEVTYDRPVAAKLVVRLENGEEWDAGPEDMKRFSLVNPHEAYRRFEDYLVSTLALARGTDLTKTHINCLRSVVECALFYDHMPNEDVAQEIRNLEAVAYGLPD